MDGAEPVEIRRYPNRRFYDRSRKRYVTLQEIEDLVLQGQEVAIVDSRDGQDITRVILAQILMERHPHKLDCIPTGMLVGMLRASDLVLESWRAYLGQSFAALEALQKAAPLANPLGWMMPLMMGRAPAGMPREEGGESESAWKRRVAELEERIRRLEPQGPAGSSRGRRQGRSKGES